MAARQKYLKREQTEVIAVQLDLDTDGFAYHKWGGEQTCKPGDWLVNNDGDVYTVDRTTFASTYRVASPGLYRKQTPVWAEQSERAGSIKTREGVTHYEAGAYLVFNDEDGKDGYAVTAPAFEAMYAPLE
jgi:hypothetical protein